MNTKENQGKETKEMVPFYVEHLIMQISNNIRTCNSFVSIIRKYNFDEIKIIEHHE